MIVQPEKRENQRAALPKQGVSPADLWQIADDEQRGDVKWRDGRVAALVYLIDDDILEVAKEAYGRFSSENGLSPKAFPSLYRFETEIICMAAGLFHGDEAVGSVTSGGTESIVLAVKIARDRARAERPDITSPEILLPFTAHPAFAKAAHYLGVESKRTPLNEEYRVDLDAYEASITENTIMMVGSAPNYPMGMVDPIPEMAALAEARSIHFHVDACVGGFFLPFAEKMGKEFPVWDFRVPGVTTISADLHKYGYTAKGASTIISRDPAIFEYQKFEFGDWPAGVYSTPNITGTRPGGPIAAAWAVMNYLGEDGYIKQAERIYGFMPKLIEGINEIPGLEVRGVPDMSIVTYGSDTFDIYAVADGLEERGWFVHRDRQPKGIHLMLSPGHDKFIDGYLRDLSDVTNLVTRGEITAGSKEARYG